MLSNVKALLGEAEFMQCDVMAKHRFVSSHAVKAMHGCVR